MRIYLMGSDNPEYILPFGDSPEMPIPRIGESLSTNHLSFQRIKDVAYDFEKESIYVVVEGYLKRRWYDNEMVDSDVKLPTPIK